MASAASSLGLCCGSPPLCSAVPPCAEAFEDSTPTGTAPKSHNLFAVVTIRVSSLIYAVSASWVGYYRGVLPVYGSARSVCCA